MKFTKQMLLENIEEAITIYLVENDVCSHNQAKDEALILRHSLTLQLNTLESFCKLQNLTVHKHNWEDADGKTFCTFCTLRKPVEKTESLPF